MKATGMLTKEEAKLFLQHLPCKEDSYFEIGGQSPKSADRKLASETNEIVLSDTFEEKSSLSEKEFAKVIKETSSDIMFAVRIIDLCLVVYIVPLQDPVC